MRALLLVIDGFGMGPLPDADLYGDGGANTALRVCRASGGAEWPVLRGLGLGNCAALLGHRLSGCGPARPPLASYGLMAEASASKDTTTGHWELAGVLLDEPFRTFPPHFPSFPEELLDSFTRQTGYSVLGNKSASGTRIIEELGSAHLDGDGLIVYTSADSVLQIAGHEDVIGVDELYSVCRIARKICDPYRIGRVIARPFSGRPGRFIRTPRRKDFSMEPPGETILDVLRAGGVETVAIGKIGDLFCERGIVRSHHDAGNGPCLDRVVQCLQAPVTAPQFIFVNLIDTDMLYGHRRDIQGYHGAVSRIDGRLAEIITLLSGDDILIITADHGCDPGFAGSDHTREYVPLLVFMKGQSSYSIGIRDSFRDVAQSLATFFGVVPMAGGHSFIGSDGYLLTRGEAR
jgi:phosphopentomutase